MNEDVIKRSDAVEVVYKALRTPPLKGVLTDTMSLAIALVQDVPSADRWIPCSERLPSENDEYIITMGKDSFNKEGHVTWAMFDKLKKKFYFPGGRVNYYIAVTAWMPRPESYMKGTDDD